jgi:hypothetical protein
MSSNAVYPVPPTIPTLIIVLGFLNSVAVSGSDLIGLRVKRTSGRAFRPVQVKLMILARISQVAWFERGWGFS